MYVTLETMQSNPSLSSLFTQIWLAKHLSFSVLLNVGCHKTFIKYYALQLCAAIRICGHIWSGNSRYHVWTVTISPYRTSSPMWLSLCMSASLHATALGDPTTKMRIADSRRLNLAFVLPLYQRESSVRARYRSHRCSCSGRISIHRYAESPVIFLFTSIYIFSRRFFVIRELARRCWKPVASRAAWMLATWWSLRFQLLAARFVLLSAVTFFIVDLDISEKC